MSNMRIKKAKGMKLVETRHPPPKKEAGENEDEKLLQCIMCNCMTIEEYLKRHIRYNHLISKDEIIDKLYNLHYPPENASVSTQTSAVSISSSPKKSRDNEDDDRRPAGKSRARGEPSKDPLDDEEVLCPACGDVEDGTPMVACGVCDSWYHWVCVGLHCKPAKGSEWLCTSCSGKAGGSRGKKKVITPEPKHKRVRSPGQPMPMARRRSGANRDDSSEEGEPRSKLKKDDGFRKKGGVLLKSKPTKPHVDYISRPEFSDDDDVPVHDDLRYSDDSLNDKDFEPQESDYDEKEMRLPSKVRFGGSEERDHKKKKPTRLSRPLTEDDYDNITRDDLRKLCQKELINATGSRSDLVGRLKRHYRKVEEKAKLEDDKPKAKKFKLTEVHDGDGLCKICGLGWELPDDLELGPLYKYGACQAHLHCLMFSSGLIQGGDETEGIVGFMPPDVDRECERGAKLKCCFCREIYATVGCCQRTCMKTYHLPCGIKFGALNEYYGNFDSYCPSHRSKREVKPHKGKSKNYVLTDLGLVPEHVDREAGFDSEKYKEMLRKIEKEYGEKKKSKDVEVKQEKNSPPTVKREKPDEIKTRPGPKSKTVQIKKKKHEEEKEEEHKYAKRKKLSASPTPTPVVPAQKQERRESQEDAPRRGGRERKTFGSDIYKSAKEELEAMLKKKEMVNLSDTFTNLAGTRRATKSVYNKGLEEEEDDEDTLASRRLKKIRSAKRAQVEVDDEDDDEEFKSKKSVPYTKPTRKATRKSPQSDSEEEDPKTFKKILKKKKANASESQSEDEEPPPSPLRSIRIKPLPERKQNYSSEEERIPTRSKKVLTPEREEEGSDAEETPRRKPGPKKFWSPEPQQSDSDESLRRKPGPRKVLTPGNQGSDTEESPRRKSGTRKVGILESQESDTEEVPRRKPGPKSRKVLTPEASASDEDQRRSPRGKKESKDNSPEETSKRKPGPKSRTPQTKCFDDEEKQNSPGARNILVTSPAKFSDSEEETKKRTSRSPRKDAESIESIEEFLVDTRVKERKDSKDSHSGSDCGTGSKKIRLTKVKKVQVESDDDDKQRATSPPNMDFEDTEPDNITENLAQNDGFTDTSGIVSANVSDEGADLDKLNFNDDDDEHKLDLSDILTNLDVQIEKEPSWPDMEHCYKTFGSFRFTCKICSESNRNQDLLEEHIKSVHKKKIPGKIIKQQEMMINIERNRLSLDDRLVANKIVADMKDTSGNKVTQKENYIETPKKAQKKKVTIDTKFLDVDPPSPTTSTPVTKEGKKKIGKQEKVLDATILQEINPPSPKTSTPLSKETKKKSGKAGKEKDPDPAELTGERYPFFKYANDNLTDFITGKGTVKQTEKNSKSPDHDSIADNIDSLLEESPEKAVRQRSRTREKIGILDEKDDESTEKEFFENKTDVSLDDTKLPKQAIPNGSQAKGKNKDVIEEKICPSASPLKPRQTKSETKGKHKNEKPETEQNNDVEEEEHVADIIDILLEESVSPKKALPKKSRGKEQNKEATGEESESQASPEKTKQKKTKGKVKSKDESDKPEPESDPEPEPRRGGRERKTVSSDMGIYKSAKEELAEMLKKKEMVNLSDTIIDHTGADHKNKTTVGKDFILWADENKSSSTRSSRSSRQEEGTPSGRSSAQRIQGSTRGASPDSTADQSDSDKRDEEPARRSRKSPPKKIAVGALERKSVESTRENLSPQPSADITGPVFECLKCDTKLMQRKDLVKKHLQQHKLTFESYIDVYLEESSPSKLSAIIDWRAEDQPTKNEDLFNSLMDEGPPAPQFGVLPQFGPKLGRPDPEATKSSGPKLGSTSLLCAEAEKENDSKGSKGPKLLFSTLASAEEEGKEDDPLSTAISSILTDEEKQELILTPLKKTLRTAGIEVAESGELRLKTSKQ